MAITQPAPAAPRRPARRPRRFWSRLHFLLRFLGLTGLLVAGAGLVLAGQAGLLESWASARRAVEDALAGANIHDALSGDWGALGTYLALGGGAAVLLALVVEAGMVLGWTAARRSAFGFNAAVQVVLAAALLVAVNVYSAGLHLSLFGTEVHLPAHYARLDWTRGRQFTLPDDVRRDLEKLRGDTTVVVYQRHKTFGRLDDKPDSYYDAAERKVVEKVKDLVDQLREVGPRFHVEVLDSNEEHFADRLNGLTEGRPELRQAIDNAPESSLFFYSKEADEKGRVQRLSFSDFYLLDKTASQTDRGGQGNLVLRYQGVEPFANRIRNIDERKPRVGIALIHEVLSTTRGDDWGLKGLRTALEDRGFEVHDIILKKWSRFAPPQGAAYTVEESALDRLEEQEASLKGTLAALERDRAEVVKVRDLWKKATTDEKTRKDLTRALARQLRGAEITAEIARLQAERGDEAVKEDDEAIGEVRQRLASTREEKDRLNVPELAERRRMTDLRAKTDRLLADCDLLIVPRMTLRNATSDFDNIPARLYRLEEAQAEAVKEFLKAGKPVLACFGPTNENPEDRGSPMADSQPEPLEEMLGRLGFRFGKQTVLFDSEVPAFAERRSALFSVTTPDIPPLLLDWQPGAGRPIGSPAVRAPRPNPILESLRLAAHSLGKDRSLDLRFRHPRPIYFDPPPGVQPQFDPEFLMTSARSWNEDQPFPTADSIPQYEKPRGRDGEKPMDDAAQDPLDKRRRGPFPVAVAVETKVPADWYASAADRPATVRVAAIGHGGFFTGKDLPPAQERLMVNTANWLLGRDDYLPQAGTLWSYPRVDLQPRERSLWFWAALGLPVLSFYLGLVVWLVRRLR